MERKEDIRKYVRKKRRALTSEEWRKGTDEIALKILSHPWFHETEDIYCYIDFDGEPGTRRIIEEAWRLGKRVWVPKVFGDRMDFWKIASYEELSPGAFSILEPAGTSEKASGGDGLMIVPGVAFDRKRNRIGYGRGYYDRYLSTHSGLRTIAVAFECQIVEEIEREETDIVPMVLVTDQALYQ